MVIQKKENFKLSGLALILVLVISLDVIAGPKKAVDVLMDSYEFEGKMTSEGLEETIIELNCYLSSCTNDEVKYRIQYRIAMMYYKSGDWEKAAGCFEEINASIDCPDLIKLCSFNMAGQIYRMQGKDKRALEQFDKLISLSYLIMNESHQPVSLAVGKLTVSAILAKAEIYQIRGCYDLAVEEYKQAIAFTGEGRFGLDDIAPVLDRLSQIYLINGNLEGYRKTCARLIRKYPEYYRTPIVRLETAAVDLLVREDISIDFSSGSLESPVKLISLIGNGCDRQLMDRATSIFKQLYSQYNQGYAGVLLGYHWAWVLDMTDRHEQAARVFEEIIKKAELINNDNEVFSRVLKTLTGYAKLQQAIIYGEKNRFNEALELVSSLNLEPDDTHMVNLSDSIEEALKILKREVPKDVKEK